MTATTSAALGAPETMPQGKATYAAGAGVALITLTNPPANGYSHAMMRDLDEAVLRARFAVLRGLYDELRSAGLVLDTLSMGMSHDLEPAIAEGASIVRVGTAIFGERARPAWTPTPTA